MGKDSIDINVGQSISVNSFKIRCQESAKLVTLTEISSEDRLKMENFIQKERITIKIKI
jgi:hypothetical protein